MSHKEFALNTAKILIDTKSILINAKDPFTYTSGRVGPVYIDCRRLISFPDERQVLMDNAAALLNEKVGIENIDMVAGGETAGIPYAAFIAERLNKPMLYVRKKPKGFGRMAQIEGCMEDEGKNVILIEDLQTDGGSKQVFINALREAGAVVKHSFVVFHYAIFDASIKNMESLGIQLHALTTWWDVLDYAKENSVYDEETLTSLEKFLYDPVQWSVDHGGKGDEDAA